MRWSGPVDVMGPVATGFVLLVELPGVPIPGGGADAIDAADVEDAPGGAYRLVARTTASATSSTLGGPDGVSVPASDRHERVGGAVINCCPSGRRLMTTLL